MSRQGKWQVRPLVSERGGWGVKEVGRQAEKEAGGQGDC